jgi:osmotically inducible lipoprotein OsmB
MKTTARTLSISALAIAMASGLGACSNMSRADKATAAGAVVGGVAGSAVTGGSTIGTVGGAVAGGVIGREIEKKR